MPSNMVDPASPPPLAVEARALCRAYGPVTALSQVSLDIRRGEFFSLLGPSGCGKTTLLRIIAGLDVADSGALSIGGKSMAGIPAHQRSVNTVFQSYALFPHLTARDNIAFGLRMKKVPRPETDERVRRVMDLVQIPALAQRRPAQLSGGEKQRVALARAIVNEPQVLLLDEPLGALDLKLRKQLQLELHQLQKRLGITFIHVTHDQDEALTMSDRIGVMNAGMLQQVATAEQIYERPGTRFVAQFVGACNVLEGRICEVRPSELIVDLEFARLVVKRDGQAPTAIGQRVALALRPEKIQLAPNSPSSSANQFRATVEDLTYSGAETQYRLRTADQTLVATLLNSQSGQHGFAIGETLLCTAPPAALLILKD